MKPFTPDKLPLENLDWAVLIPYMSKANTEIGRFDGLIQSLQNPALLLRPLSIREAVLSSKIEGTQASFEDVMAFEVNPKKKTRKYSDIQEVINYRQAMTYAVEKLEELPLTFRLIKGIQKVLLSNTHANNNNPGNFRTNQVHIGPEGFGIDQATFIPPAAQQLPDLCSNLEKYIHFEEKDTLVQLAIIHAQFEIIYPFWDGNGRTGRILIPLFLYYKKMISQPTFYLSEYLEKNREEYYTRLNYVSQKNDWEGWICFFMKAIIEQSKSNIEKAQSIMYLYEETKERIRAIPSPRNMITVLDFLFTNPLFNSRMLMTGTGLSRDICFRILPFLVKNNIISDDRQTKNRIYFFTALLQIVG